MGSLHHVCLVGILDRAFSERRGSLPIVTFLSLDVQPSLLHKQRVLTKVSSSCEGLCQVSVTRRISFLSTRELSSAALTVSALPHIVVPVVFKLLVFWQKGCPAKTSRRQRRVVFRRGWTASPPVGACRLRTRPTSCRRLTPGNLPSRLCGSHPCTALARQHNLVEVI